MSGLLLKRKDWSFDQRLGAGVAVSAVRYS